MGERRAGKLDPVLMQPKRFLIATYLYLRGPMTMSRLRSLVGLTWGDLDSNLRLMAREGYVALRKVFTQKGPRTVVELTEKGRRAYEETAEALEEILRMRREHYSTNTVSPE